MKGVNRQIRHHYTFQALSHSTIAYWNAQGILSPLLVVEILVFVMAFASFLLFLARPLDSVVVFG